jgi:hypothetical protein
LAALYLLGRLSGVATLDEAKELRVLREIRLELPEPRIEAPRALRKLSRVKHRSTELVDPWISKPLFKGTEQ